MNKKNLILIFSLILIVFLSASAISAETSLDDNSTDVDILEVEDSDVQTAKEITVNATDTNDQIQEKINALDDGDTLNFEKGDYYNISLYVTKNNVTINGNGATLYGYDTLSEATVPEIVLNKTTDGGFGISNLATLYIFKTNGLVLKDINIVAGANSGTDKATDSRYTNCVIYNEQSSHTTISNVTIDGCSWGIYSFKCKDITIENSNVKNQLITAILSFQSPRSQIRNNTVTNAKNHGIDVRHQVGSNATITDNTVIGSKEGIYLLHSSGHTVTGNTIQSCSLSSITCCGAANVNIENNKLYNTRIGILLGGSTPAGSTAYTAYSNIKIGDNEWKPDVLPMPPSFQYYVAEAKGDYASIDAMMGTHTDSSISEITFVEYSEIEKPKEIIIDYDSLLKPTERNVTITAGMNNTEIQAAIDALSNGDTLIFEENAVFENICLCIDKNIKIIGNNATLKGLNAVNNEIIQGRSLPSTYSALSYSAVLYSINNTGVVISNLNIISNYPNYNKGNDPEYATACIFAENSKNLTITGCSVDGASFGLFVGFQKNGCPNSIITNNKVSNQYTTGILCFGSHDSVIINNTVKDAKNHGIDVRFLNNGYDVTVFNNEVYGAKEGIFLLHSYGHKVYENRIYNSKISSITCYGSGNEYIFNNTFSGSRIAILLSGKYYNVTIGKNTFIPDKLGKLPPTFEYFLVKAEDKYQDSIKVQRTYSDKETVTISAPDVSLEVNKDGALKITLIDQNNKVMGKKLISVKFNNATYNITADENGTATLPIANLAAGKYIAEISYAGNDNYAPAKANATVNVDKISTALTASGKTVYLQAIEKGMSYQVTLKTDGKGIEGKEITINFNGKPFTAKTNANGIATFKLTATSTGSKKATITFKGDDTYKAATAAATIKITKEASKITAAKKTFKAKVKTKKYTVTLKSKSGKAISKAKVTIKVKGKTYKATTNSKGKATFKITKLTKKGKYTAKVNFSGNKYFNKSSKSVKITVKK